MLSDADPAFVATALALCSKGKRIAIGLTNGTKEDHITHMKTLPVLRLNEPNDYKNFCGSVVHHVLSYSSLLPLQSLKEIVTCEKQSFLVTVYSLHDFDTVTLLQTWNSKVPHSMSPNHWNCAADMIAVRQTTHFFFQLHNMCYCVKQMKFE